MIILVGNGEDDHSTVWPYTRFSEDEAKPDRSGSLSDAQVSSCSRHSDLRAELTSQSSNVCD